MNLIYGMVQKINKIPTIMFKPILLLYFISNILFSNCQISLSENFFNENIIGYYLSAININTGESNVLLFDYQVDLIGDCDNLDELEIEFDISIHIPQHSDELTPLTSGIFKLDLTESIDGLTTIPFRNTDINLDTKYLPGNVRLIMNQSDYNVHITDNQIDELSSLIIGLGRIPNGMYYFNFDLICPNDFDCNNISLHKTFDIFLPSYLNLVSPGSSSISDTTSNQVYIPYPTFQWSADYCSNCNNYEIRICEFNNNTHNSLEDAISDVSILPTSLGFYDIGSMSNVFQYPVSGFENLIPGKLYVWQIKRSFETTYGMQEELSDVFIFKMNDYNYQETEDETLVSQQNLSLIMQLIGDSKFNELFNEDSGILYNYDPSSTILVNGVEYSLEYLSELIELLNNSNIEIIEVEVE